LFYIPVVINDRPPGRSVISQPDVDEISCMYQGRSQDFISTEAKRWIGDLGRSPQRCPGAQPLVRGSGGEASL